MDDVGPDIPLPWERLLWTSRAAPFLARRGTSYALTDFRLVSRSPAGDEELILQEIADVSVSQSRFERAFGYFTLRAESRRAGRPPLVLVGIRSGPQLAALLELLAGLPQADLSVDDVHAALAWEPSPRRRGIGEAAATFAVLVVAVAAVIASTHGPSAAAVFAGDDPIYPNGIKRSEQEITRFMESDVMPWAREVLGPLKGGADRISCQTCHGRQAEADDFAMPAVSALPQTDFRAEGWEVYSDAMDAQMRNAIYGYLAEPEKQQRAGYMREVVMPGMARLLHRPAYDFTRTYAFNRSHLAFGCYHCHRVK